MVGYWNRMANFGLCEPIEPSSESIGEDDPIRRHKIMCEIDAIVARRVFGLTTQDLEYILDSFAAQRRSEEREYDGVYLSKELIVSLFGKMKS